VARMGDTRHSYKIPVGKPEGNRLLVRTRHRWEDNIITNPREIRWEGVDWIHLAQDRDQQRYTREHGNEPSGSINGWEILD